MRALEPYQATVTVGGLFVLGLLAGSVLGRVAVARATGPYVGLERFARMLTAIESDYVEPIEQERLIDAAIHGMVTELDPHSRWMSAEAVEALQDDSDGRRTGFGLEVVIDAEGVEVERVLPGSPAEKDGIKAGDRILTVNGDSLHGLPMSEIMRRFEGAKGERAVLQIQRASWESPKVVSALRDDIHIPATEGIRLQNDVMYVRFVDFQHQSAEELEQIVGRLQAEANMKWAGLIFDLRDNTGGLLDEAVAVADLFLDEGVIVSVEGRATQDSVHTATPGGFPQTLPVVVLINGLSASASEIVAGSLADAGRATLVGSQSYGKGSVQQLYRNNDGSALKLTVAKYRLGSGREIPARNGLEPEVIVQDPQRRRPSVALRDRLASLPMEPAVRAELNGLLAKLRDPPLHPRRRRWRVDLAERVQRDPVIQAGLTELLQ